MRQSNIEFVCDTTVVWLYVCDGYSNLECCCHLYQGILPERIDITNIHSDCTCSI